MRNISKYYLLTFILLAVPATFANAQSESIAAVIKKNPGQSPA